MVFLIWSENIVYIIVLLEDTYISNILVGLRCPQQQDFKIHGKRINNDGYNQGGKNVFDVIEIFLRYINGKQEFVFEDGLF